MSRTARQVLVDATIVGWIVFQVAAPLSWYLSDRGGDERFAWRMFSTNHLAKCEVSVEELHETARGTERRSPRLDTVIPATWVGSLTRGRPRDIDRLLQTRCDAGAQSVTFERTCEGRLPERTRRSCR